MCKDRDPRKRHFYIYRDVSDEEMHDHGIYWEPKTVMDVTINEAEPILDDPYLMDVLFFIVTELKDNGYFISLRREGEPIDV